MRIMPRPHLPAHRSLRAPSRARPSQRLEPDDLHAATRFTDAAATWGRTRFREPVARGYEAVDEGTGQVYASVLTQRGRELRPPLDWDRIGAILQGLVEGLGLRYKIDPLVVSSSSDSAPDLYATAVAAVLAVLTRPIGDDASVDEASRVLLDGVEDPSVRQKQASKIRVEPPLDRWPGS
jgi:hypothetical protein